jgi:hypothetical protein
MNEEQKTSDAPSDWAKVKMKEQENWGKVIEFIGPGLELLKAKIEKHDAPIARTTLWGIIIMTLIVVGSTTWLVYEGKLGESAFTFIIGTLFGMLITMAKGFFGGGE